MRKASISVRVALTLFLLQISFLGQNLLAEENIALRAYAAGSVIKVDGNLDEEVWKKASIVDEYFITYSPTEGDKFPYRTSVWAAYDDENIYFAFYCYNPEPSRIKTSLTKRDEIWEDDWVGLSLDTSGSKQSAYQFLVNPNGIQGDLLLTNGQDDSSPDWVWSSGAQIQTDGYSVEIAIPLRSIRYKSGKDIILGVIFYRNDGLSGDSASWPSYNFGKGELNSMLNLGFDELKYNSTIEVLPALTYSLIQDRRSAGEWYDADSQLDAGVDLKYGITSSLTLELTYNPDFSQVESDEFQVEANRRYPVFNDEKRPFFMEANNFFNLAGTADYLNMYTAVHTRNIVDPEWGFRLTGESGKLSYGILSAGDEWPKSLISGDTDEDYNTNAIYYLGRMKYSLEGQNYLGLLLSGREYGPEYNRTLSGDFNLRLTDSHSIQGFYTYSESGDKDLQTDYSGSAMSLVYFYYTPSLLMELDLEHFDENFRMDSAFYNRTGISSVKLFVNPIFYPNPEELPWLRYISPYVYYEYDYDHATKGEDNILILCLMSGFALDSSLTISYMMSEEYWAGTTFDKKSLVIIGSIKPTNWLLLSTRFDLGDRIYYNTDFPFLGDLFGFYQTAKVQMTDKLILYASYRYQAFDSKDTGERVYDLDILRFYAKFQFNKYLFIRGEIQYDSYREVVLTDLLASFTYIPGTVIHIGYGSLYEKPYWTTGDEEDATLDTDYYQMTQSLFLKLSYRFQL